MNDKCEVVFKQDWAPLAAAQVAVTFQAAGHGNAARSEKPQMCSVEPRRLPSQRCHYPCLGMQLIKHFLMLEHCRSHCRNLLGGLHEFELGVSIEFIQHLAERRSPLTEISVHTNGDLKVLVCMHVHVRLTC